ncbi:hypothetical protein CONPUDRAFT_145569 [Coniophora puteana RWD-64-598 SS2]|uniref:Rab-GAP TBC domain-containing protein n=1 Tax=Coniophora puteana (strain RWD-64-598) TaxID=741705 RepID=A0A5M3MHK5_CONPW|nr:uncharacterized protein CONPUDRAFT_145569 [Coniophora puteana RWD-64-598 SS2]EIW78264.1 hypothetical protein CONPUDRAFT_145569 [Coniophora puteana RWD-64-598 SS2]
MSPEDIPETQDAKNNTLDTTINWKALRERSLRPGGFGEERAQLWAKLLHANAISAPSQHSSSEPRASEHDRDASTDETSAVATPDPQPHPDEHQIGLDTNRSFVLYPVVQVGADREKLQSQLHDLLVTFFRKRRKLHYFQGYHDIVTVLFLTLPEELQLPCVEQLSLHRVRDSMGLTLEPVLGLLRILLNLLRLVDGPYASVLESTSPLPFFALSNLLTLFSHDMPTLPLIQHVFDYLLCRPPITVVYLAAAIILARKEEVERLVEEDEEGLIHSLLSGLPPLSDDDGRASEKPGAATGPAADVATSEQIGGGAVDKHNVAVSIDGTTPSDLNVLPGDTISEPDGETLVAHSGETDSSASTDDPDADHDGAMDDETPTDVAPSGSESDANEAQGSPSKKKDAYPVTSPSIATEQIAMENENGDGEQPPVPNGAPNSVPSATSASDSEEPTPSTGDCPSPRLDTDNVDLPNGASTAPASDADSASSCSSDSPLPRSHSSPTPTPLPSLLARASELYALYPPSHPALSVPSILGPKSAMHTWHEDPSLLPSSAAAEDMVSHPEEIVYPFPEPSKGGEDDSDLDSSFEDARRAPRRPARPARQTRRGAGGRKGVTRTLAGRIVARRTVLAGAVLVLGIAMAYYGARTQSGTGSAFGGSRALGALAWWGGLMEYISQR